MRKLPLFFSTLIITLYSCGPSAQEKQRIETLKQDSIKSVLAIRQDSIIKAKIVKDSLAKEAIIERDSTNSEIDRKAAVMASQMEANKQAAANKQALYQGTKNRLEYVNAQLTAAYDKMKQIKEFKFGRSQSDREKEIQNQSLVIQHLQDEATDLRGKLKTLSPSVTF
jgi:hypothetical protein